MHREENVDVPANLAMLLGTVNALAGRYGRPVIVSVHPRTRNRLDGLDVAAGELNPLVRLWSRRGGPAGSARSCGEYE
jgi:UDP-N-acetylglucosamine 2-epimerase (non-hydrolysing)